MQPLLLASALVAAAVQAQPASLAAPLAGLSFLTGSWSSGRGHVADTDEDSTGSSVVTVEANGGALLRRDHTELFDKAGRSKGGFDQIMLIYAEGGTLRADYSDGSHVIHYTRVTVTPGRAVTFQSEPAAGAPAYRLKYQLQNPTTLTVDFTMAPPGGGFRPVAFGLLSKAS
jgi:hypothetical protein